MKTKVFSNINIGKLTTFGIPSICDKYIEFNELDQITDIIDLIKSNKRFYILGAGSNSIFLNNFDGLVIKMNLKGKFLLSETQENVLVDSFAGENWDEFVLWTLENNWFGLENLTGIPGEVGACPIQNIGAYGAEVKDFIHEVEFLNLKTNKIEKLSNAECNFSYRDSIFKQSLKSSIIILRVTFKLSKIAKVNTQYADIMNEMSKNGISEIHPLHLSQLIKTIRERKLPDPKLTGNSGSFFKNPVMSKTAFSSILLKHPNIPFYNLANDEIKIAAGWLIEQCGWKGKSLGNCGVHENQALVLVNLGEAKTKDLKSIIYKIQKDVFEKFAVKIEPEVNLVE